MKMRGANMVDSSSGLSREIYWDNRGKPVHTQQQQQLLKKERKKRKIRVFICIGMPNGQAIKKKE